MAHQTTDKTLEFFFDFGSPNAYLAYTQLPALLECTGARLAWRPMLLGGVFKATNNQAPGMTPCEPKRRHMLVDMQRFVDHYGIEFRFNAAFPVNTITLMRGAMALIDDARFASYVDTVFRAMWVDNIDLGDPAALQSTLTAAGFDWHELAGRVADPAVKNALREATEDAVPQGIFGAPSFIVDGELFFGQDRLDFVERALSDS